MVNIIWSVYGDCCILFFMAIVDTKCNAREPITMDVLITVPILTTLIFKA